MPASASDACEPVERDRADLAARTPSAAPARTRRRGSAASGSRSCVICRFSKTTVRATLSTCVRAVAKITPNVSSFAPVGLDRERRAEVDLVAVPLVDLRLVDEHLRVGEVDDARPGVGGKLRCGAAAGAAGAAAAAGAGCADAMAEAQSSAATASANGAGRRAERHDSSDIQELAADAGRRQLIIIAPPARCRGIARVRLRGPSRGGADATPIRSVRASAARGPMSIDRLRRGRQPLRVGDEAPDFTPIR